MTIGQHDATQAVKTCSKCGEEKPLDGFSKDKSRGDGRAYRCKECVSEQQRRYYEENREYYRRYYEENRNEILDKKRRYHEENWEERQEYNRRYYEENRNEILDKNRHYHYENREEIREQKRRYREGSREFINAKKSSHHATSQELSKALSFIPSGTPWSEEEDALLMADNGMTTYEKATHLGRTYSSCMSRIQKLKKLRRTTNA